MIAPPGAGKGTQGAIIANHFGVPHIATGDLLRDHVARNTPLGRTVAEHLDRGDLVPDDVVLEMVRLAFVDVARTGGGYVLDGLPRTMAQARATYEIGKDLGVTANVALHLKVDDAEVTRRLLARAALEGRSDDTAEVIARRLALYHDVTSPIVDWYAERGILITVDASRPVDQVAREILTALEVMKSVVDVVAEGDRRPIDLSPLDLSP
jgi:adenylate kinase